MKSDHQKRIEMFMKMALQEVPTRPIMPSAEVRKLRASLILEEALETIQGLGFRVKEDEEDGDLVLVESGKPDMIEIIDGCGDVSVVTIGTLSAMGVSDKPVLEAIDMNNLAKFGPGSFRDAKGKWIKPAGHQPPDIKAVLLAQGMVACDAHK